MTKEYALDGSKRKFVLIIRSKVVKEIATRNFEHAILKFLAIK